MTLIAKPNTRLLHILILTVLGVAGWFSFAHFSEARQQFTDAVQDLEQSTALAEQITLLRQKPDRAVTQSRSEQALAEAIEKSAIAAGVARERVARIEPQQPRRAGDSDYLEHATVVQLDGVTLAQLAATLTSLRASGAGHDQLRVSALRISAPYQAAASAGAEPWNVELSLSYFIYSPKTIAPRRL
jgi:hypothetical protein